MEKVEEAYWRLLRAGLWGDASQLVDFSPLDPAQWKKALALAANSGTMGIVIDGVELLPTPLRPQQKQLSQMLVVKVNLMKKHTKHNHTLYVIMQLLREIGVDGVLMKGQGASRYYYRPESRNCGDIDIYIGEEKIDYLLSELKARNITYQEEIDDSEKHAVFIYDDVRIELHRYSAFMTRHKANIVYQQWWHEGTQKPTLLYVTDEGSLSEKSEPGAEVIKVAAVTQNVFFLFFHVFHHFISMQVQFRQFCDMARALAVNSEKIDREELGKMLQQFSLMEPWQAFCGFLHQRLGLDKAHIPFYDEKACAKSEQIVKRLRKKVLYPQKDKIKRPKNRLINKMISYGMHLNAFVEVMPLFPQECMHNIWHATVYGIKSLFRLQNRYDAAENYKRRVKS